jgi:hypothetical protein
MPRRPPAERSGKLDCDGRQISYHFEERSWSVAISDIRLIAEFTTELGPWADDYFLVFLTAPENGWHEASFYAEGRDEMLDRLGKTLGVELELGLCNSAVFKTRIIWPLHLVDEALLILIPHKTAWGRFRQKWLGASVDTILSDAAKSAFKG